MRLGAGCRLRMRLAQMGKMRRTHRCIGNRHTHQDVHQPGQDRYTAQNRLYQINVEQANEDPVQAADHPKHNGNEVNRG